MRTLKSVLVIATLVAGGLAVTEAQETDPVARAQAAAEEARQQVRKEQAAAEEKQRQQRERDLAEAKKERERILEEQRLAREKLAQVIPVDVEVIISRYQGDKKTSSLPYLLTVNAVYTKEAMQEPLTRVRMGGKVPVPVMAPPTDATGIPPGFIPGPVQYQDVGTRIDCGAKILDNGRFDVFISVEDTAIAPSAQSSATPSAVPPVIRTFQASNQLVLRDGQSRQFTAASDRITGEVVKVDVTLKVAK